MEELLGYMLDDPAAAVALACRWRANALATLSSDSLGVLSDMLRKKGSDSWQFRQLGRNLTSETCWEVLTGSKAAIGLLPAYVASGMFIWLRLWCIAEVLAS